VLALAEAASDALGFRPGLADETAELKIACLLMRWLFGLAVLVVHLLTLLLPTPYPLHQTGTSPLEMTLTSAINIIPGQSGTYRHLRRRVTQLTRGFGSDRRLGATHDTRKV
jgi:hypothetical protein